MSKVNKDKFFKLCNDKANEMLEKYMQSRKNDKVF